MKYLYPEIEPSGVYQIDSGGIHKIYLEESGNPEGIPVVFLHGGPGGGCSEKHRRYFNPAKYRIVIFDQRGVGRSEPVACVEENTTAHLLRDMEIIRETLNIEQWVMFGGSWGATLALLYAETYPERVSGMVIRGTFLARQKDLDWFVRDVGRILPDYWQKFIGHISGPERDDAVQAYYKRVHGNDKGQRDAAVKAWSAWSARVVTYQLTEAVLDGGLDMEKMIQDVKIETHYARHKYFIDEDQILRDIDKIPDVPVSIIHGRRDMTCTLDSSWLVHTALSQSELNIVANGGHLASEPAMVDALISATDSLASRLIQ